MIHFFGDGIPGLINTRRRVESKTESARGGCKKDPIHLYPSPLPFWSYGLCCFLSVHVAGGGPYLSTLVAATPFLSPKVGLGRLRCSKGI